jgi:hypothetical protein
MTAEQFVLDSSYFELLAQLEEKDALRTAACILLAAHNRFHDKSEHETAFLWQPREGVKRKVNL